MMSTNMKRVTGACKAILLIAGYALVPTVWGIDLPNNAGKKGIVMGTAIRLDARNASQHIGRKGIVMGTCRQLKGGALIMQGLNGKNYQLADGVYKGSNGIQIHVRRGGVARITYSR